MEFNASKCHVLHLGRGNKEYKYTMGGVELDSVEEEKDVGVMIHHTLRPSLQCAKASARATQVLGQLSRAIGYRDMATFLNLYSVYVRPQLEYAVVSWSPWTKGGQRMLGQGAAESSWHGDKPSSGDIRGEASGGKHDITASKEREGGHDNHVQDHAGV